MALSGTADLHLLVIEASRFRPSTEESDAHSRPPYPTPHGLVPLRDVALAALAARVQHDPDPMCSLRLYEPAAPFRRRAELELKQVTGFDCGDTIRLLLAGGLISIDTAEQTIAGRRDGCFTQRAIVYRLLADNNIAKAQAAADSPHLGDKTWVGWRAIGEHHARHGDSDAFLAIWPKYQARSERAWIRLMRSQLVESVSRTRGWREAVSLCGDKRIGAYYGAALRPLVDEGQVTALDRLMSTEHSLSGLSEITRLSLLVRAMTPFDPVGPKHDHPDLERILARILAIDPTESKAAARSRDLLLWQCWPAIGDEPTLRRVRSAVRTPRIRRELTRLPREVPCSTGPSA